MRYLECIEMLQYLLKRMCAGQRKQVPVSACDEVQSVVIQIQKKLDKDLTPLEQAIVRDLMGAIALATETSGMLNLTDNMKNSIVDGLNELLAAVALKAFEYYRTHDFDPTPEIIPIMRMVVQVAVDKGVFA